VSFVELASARNTNAVLVAIARAIGLGEIIDRPLQEELTNRLRVSRELLVLETCVSFGSESAVNLVDENIKSPTQAFTGHGCRPTRPWIMETLRRDFAHVYVPRSQPDHAQFPIDWTRPEAHRWGAPS
jgi:hypothetical protein